MAAGLGRDVIGAGRRWQQPVVVASAAAVFCALVVLPLVAPLAVGAEASSADAGRAILRADAWSLLLRSMLLSAAVAAVAGTVGTVLGLLLARTDIVARRALLILHAFPFFLPPFLLALGWFHLFGRRGFFGGETSARWLFGDAGHVATLGLAFAPLVSALTALAARHVDPSLLDAARVCARPRRVLTDILLPAVRPAAALGSLFAFALAFSELGVPMFLRVHVYPAAVFSRLGGIDYAPAEALALVLPLLPVALLLLLLERARIGRAAYDSLGLRRTAGDPLPLGRWRLPVSAACWAFALLGAVPIAALAACAWGGRGFDGLSNWIGGSLSNSLAGSAIAATAIVALALVLGHAGARRIRAARFVDAAGVLAFLTPAVVLGAGLIALWNRPQTGFIYGGLGIVVLGYVARYAIVGMRAVGLAIAQSPVTREQAAATLGAGYLRRLFGLVVPMHRRALGFAWLLAFVFCLRDLETAVLCYPPGGEPLTVRLFTLEANGPEPIVAALATVHVLVTATVLSGGGLMLGARSSR